MEERTFYDRKQEINLLKEKYNSLKFGEMVVLYGRRRVGKTELIKQFLKTLPQKKSLYLYVDLINKRGMLDSFSSSIQEQLKENIIFHEFEDFLKYAEEKSTKEKFVLAIDEFQRFLDISPDFITKLQNYWDSRLKNKKLMLILVGSSIGMIQKITNSKAGALYGRGTKIKISPFRYADFRLMFDTLSEEKKILIYSVFGGTPYYLEKAKMIEGDIYKKIYELITKKGANLFEEPKNLLEYENIRIHAKYNSILQATASGKETLKEISDFTKIPSNVLTPYLKKLDELLDLIGKKNPILGKERLGRYYIKDNFFKFWYKFIFPNQSALNLGNIDFVNDLIKENLNSYVGRIFEDVVKELLVLYNTKEIKGLKLNFENIGSWWDRGNAEIDVLAYNLKEKKYLVGEIKWTNKKLDLDVVKELERKYKLINRQGKYDFIFVSKSGFTENAISRIKELNGIFLDLKDIEELFDKAN